MVIVDDELLRRACPDHGGWYAEQLQILGVERPTRSGWKYRARGTELTQEQADRLVALRDGPNPEQPLLFQR